MLWHPQGSHRDLRYVGSHPEGGEVILGRRKLKGRVEFPALGLLLSWLPKVGLIGGNFHQVSLCKAQQGGIVWPVHDDHYIACCQVEVLVRAGGHIGAFPVVE